MTSIDRIIETIIGDEGGFVDDPNDPGGPTKFGITIDPMTVHLGRQATIWDIRNLDKSTARTIYRKQYVVGPWFDRIEDNGLRIQVIDAGVLHGVGWASRCLQEIVGVKVDGDIGDITLGAINFADRVDGIGEEFFHRRQHRITRHVQRNPGKLEYLTGWMDRAVRVFRTSRIK